MFTFKNNSKSLQTVCHNINNQIYNKQSYYLLKNLWHIFDDSASIGVGWMLGHISVIEGPGDVE